MIEINSNIHYGSAGYNCQRALMISSVEITNFRCFQHFKVPKCSLINVIVGDNGIGKTALLEAMFLASGSSPELGIRFRVQRGIDGNITGTPTTMHSGVFGDLYYKRDVEKRIEIILHGDRGAKRSFAVESVAPTSYQQFGIVTFPFKFSWCENDKQPRSVSPMLLPNGQLNWGDTGEERFDHSYFAANSNVGSTELAQKYSALSIIKKDQEFTALITQEFSAIRGLSIQVISGAPIVCADVDGLDERIPVNNISGAINRLIAILATIVTSKNGVIFIDECENGIYYKHLSETWRIIIKFAKQYNCQVFTTTHSEEWLRALVNASSYDIDISSLWRLERNSGQPLLRQFFGNTFRNGIDAGGELR